MILTLSEKTTIVNAYYLFEFISVGNSEDTKYFIGTDISINPIRYNEFTIIENATEDLENATISINPGEYYFNVYEQSSSSNLDPSGLNLVEKGIVQVLRSTSENATFAVDQPVIKTFNG